MVVPDGLTLGYFHRFIDIHGGRGAFQGLTTAQVCFKFAVPYTIDSQLFLVDHVRLHTNDGDYVKPATCLDSFFLGRDEPVLWFCQTTFKQSLEAVGNVVMILHPWNNPATLTRSWCIFEVYVSILVGANFQEAMASNEVAEFLDDVLADISSFYMMLSNVNCKEAKSTILSDKESIDQGQKIQRHYLHKDFKQCRGYRIEPQSEWEPTLVNVVADLEEILGPMHIDTLNCMLQLGHFFSKQASNKSVDILRVVYTRLTEVCGPLAPSTLHAKVAYIDNQFGTLCNDDFFNLMNDCIAEATSVLGPNHPTTL
ncbi:hypothetical protein THRCLA_20250 [Thraustotheca clavata]|uniref:Uncharacterized protein n=1 Tax=Thraustotheca clavata TaxID=74557 RepID=A0A1W0A9N8_9STRA|nr:hypothetical protein THRCLA_20250 [Thraustotheca clavata]